ncbi:MAG TPA: trehalose-6-phosphate synthase [Terriglobia bacterium]|nr:trehalose-6-phosphate synthase [Terriglobia bacterium]
MRLGVRLITGLIAGISLVTFLFARYQVRAEKQALRNDLETRVDALGQSLQQTAEPLLLTGLNRRLQIVIDELRSRQHLYGVAIYNAEGKPFLMTPNLDGQLNVTPAVVSAAISQDKSLPQTIDWRGTPLMIYAVPLHGHGEAGVIGGLALFADMNYIEAQQSKIWREAVTHVLAQVLLIVLITLLIVRWTVVRPMARTAQWLRAMRTGNFGPRPPEWRDNDDLFKPLAQEVTHLAKSLDAARASAAEEARLREAGESIWTAERLRVQVQNKLKNSSLLVVSNREPYMHVRRGKSLEAVVPASGLVTALEPILCACNGTWVAHGSGDADRETVDEHDHLSVPPDEPQYTLRRVWLSQEEEEGYYFGFANEGLWPLCHIAHIRPTFRAEDWARYQEVNLKFAEAVLCEMEGTSEPALLVQDYHFALLPRLVKEKRPDARVAIFWHIPWPNPEAFGICPWQRELLDGLLGADLIGFHIQAHCTNFLETIDRALECRIEWERFAVNRHDHLTEVKPFPISVACNGAQAKATTNPGGPTSPYLDRATLLKQHGVEATFMGIGVDRVDYTKGILERFLALERFLDKYPQYRGQFTLVQVAAPSRTRIRRYHELFAEVHSEAERINWKFESGKWKPIVLLERHHSHEEIARFYRSADVCLVTALHDGMNLVAKEFVAARDDDRGALILSGFTGASRELQDALLVNPYDIEQVADAIRYALEMDPVEREARMTRMRRVVRENNIYRWAADLIAELSEIRLEKEVSIGKA